MSAVGELTVNIVGDMSKLSSAFSKASSEVGKFGSSVSGIGSSMTSKVGSALSTVGTAAIVTGTALGAGLVVGGVKATTMFQDFEKAVSNAASVTGKTGEAFNQAKANISAVAQELGQATAFSSSQAADAMYNLASAGYDVSVMSSKDLTPMLNLAAATQYDLAETTRTTASTLSQFGLGFDSAGKVADVFTKVIGSSQANMDKLSNSMTYVGTISHTVGMSLEETTATLGQLYNAGMDGSTAGTSLRGVLASLIAPTDKAVGVLHNMGLTVDDINPSTNKFSDVVQRLADHGLDANTAFALFGREAAPAMLALTSKVGDLKSLTTTLQDAGGAAEVVANEQLDTLAGSLDSLSGSIENMMINIGQALAPTIRQVADAIVPMIPTVQDFVVSIVNIFVSFIGQLGKTVESLKTIGATIFDVLSNVFEAVAGSGSGIANSAASIINDIMSRIAGIVVDIAPKIQGAITGTINFIRTIVSGLSPTFQSLSLIATRIINLFRELFLGISGSNSLTAAATITSVINTISSVLARLVLVATTAFYQILPTLQTIFSTIVSTVQGILSTIAGVVNSYLPTFTLIGKFISDTFSQIPVVISDISAKLAPTWNNLGLIFDAGSRLITSAIQPLISTFSTLFNSLSNSTSIDSISTTIANFFNTVTEAIANFMMSLAENGGISGAIESAFNFNLNTATDSIKTAFDAIKNVFDTGKNVITGFISDLAPSWDNLKSSFDSIKTIILEVVPSFASFFGTLGGSSGSTAVSVTSLLAGVINTLTGAIAGLLGWLADNPKIVKFGLALAGVAVAASGLVIGLASVISVLAPIFAAISSGIAFVSGLSLSWASLGTVVSVIGTSLFPTLAAAIGTVGGIALPALTAAFSVASGVIGVITYTVIPILVEALGLLISPIGLVIGAIALLYVAWTKNWFDIQGKTGEAVAFIKEKWNQFTSELGRLPGVASTALSTLAGVFTTAFNNIIAGIQNWITRQQERYAYAIVQLNSFKAQVIQRWNEIKASVLIKLNETVADIQNWISRQQAKYSQAVTQLNSFKAQITLKWLEIKSNVLTKFNELIVDIQNWISRQQAKFTQSITSLNAFRSQLILKWTEIKLGVLAKFNELVADAQNWVTRQKEKFNLAVSSVTDLKSKIISAFQDMLSSIRSKISDIVSAVSELPSKIRSTATDWYNAGKNLVQNLIDGIGDKITALKNKVSEMTSLVASYLPMNSPSLKGALSKLPKWNDVISSPLSSSLSTASKAAKNAGSSIISSISSGIKNAASSVYNAASSTLKKVSNLFPHSPAKEGPFKTLPNWDAVFLDPLTESINKINTLSSPLSTALSNIRNPVDANISSGLNTISNVTTSNSYSYGGDTLNLGGVTLANNLDVNALFDAWEKRMANKRRARGI